MNAALKQILEKGDRNCFSLNVNSNQDLTIKGDSEFIEELLENETLVIQIKQLLLKHQGRKNYQFIERADTIDYKVVIDFPKISKPIELMKRLEVRSCVTIYLQKLGYGSGGLKKYGKAPTPLWWPYSPEWNVDWATWGGPSRTKVDDLKTLLSNMMTHFNCKYVNNVTDSE